MLLLYTYQPREMLLRGQYTSMYNRLDRISRHSESAPNPLRSRFSRVGLANLLPSRHSRPRLKTNLQGLWKQDRVFEGHS